MGRAGLVYGLFAFGLGFVLGTARQFLIAPGLGTGIAVLLELPIMLLACWWWAGRVVARYRPAGRDEALAIGLIGMAVVLAGEFIVGVTLMRQTPGDWIASLTGPTGQLGLIAQLLAAAMPLMQARRQA